MYFEGTIKMLMLIAPVETDALSVRPVERDLFTDNQIIN